MSFFSYLKISGPLPSFYASIKSQIFTQFFKQLWFDKAIQALPLKPLNTIYAYFYTWFNTHSLLVALCLFCVLLGPSKKKVQSLVKNTNVKMSVREFNLH